MDIAVKQRILGGVVLLAAAILFLPVLLEGAGVQALRPPTPPTAPSTPTTQDLAPALQQQAQNMAKDISASHGEPTFYPVEPAITDELAPTPATPEQYRLQEPTARPAPNADVLAEQQLAANLAAEKAAKLKAEAAAAAAAQAKLDDQSVVKTAAEKKALADKALADKKAAAEKKTLAEKKAAAEKAKAEKLAAEKVAADKKAAVAQTTKTPTDPDPALPQAWVVQVARLNAPEKANALVEKLRAKGYRASAAGASDSWRVIIGPELDKSVAESIKRRLAEDPQLKLSGWIQAYRP
jgi:cell division septation protein DedD